MGCVCVMQCIKIFFTYIQLCRVCVVPDVLDDDVLEILDHVSLSELIALDRFNKEQNKKYSAEIFAFYKEQLGLEYSRYVNKL